MFFFFFNVWPATCLYVPLQTNLYDIIAWVRTHVFVFTSQYTLFMYPFVGLRVRALIHG